jgi:hypothetical protein
LSAAAVIAAHSLPGLDPGARAQLDAQGFLLVRGGVPAEWVALLQAAFDAGELASDLWPVPRGADWRHAQVDLDPHVQAACRLPVLIEAVRHVLKVPFFLSQVEGRAPRQGNRPQPLHRDSAGNPGRVMAAMIWLDPYGPGNGATQIVPGSHRGGEDDEAAVAEVLSGEAGDVLIFDPDVLHGATTNHSGAPRRSLLVSYAAATLYDAYRPTEGARGVRMDTGEVFGA